MALCDMCGKENSSIVAMIEGTELNVCLNCAKFGKPLRKIKISEQIKEVKLQKKHEEKEEIIETIVEGYGKLIKEAREKLGLKQEDFAKKINEKVSVIHSLESEHHEPNIDLARKLEKFLKIRLVEEEKIENPEFGKTSSSQLTIGDLIKIKK